MTNKEEYKKEGLRRMLIRKKRRFDKYVEKISNPRYKCWSCDMGYSDCDIRGWCNGDC